MGGLNQIISTMVIKAFKMQKLGKLKLQLGPAYLIRIHHHNI